MDCRVRLEAGVRVYDVETNDEALQIAISKVGEMLNPDLNYVEIEKGDGDAVLIAAGESLVALELEMKVFNVDEEEHASRIARKEIGQELSDIPLEIIEVEEFEDEVVEED